MARSVSLSKEDFRRMLRRYGLTETKIEEISKNFERNNHHLEVINFVINLERAGVNRRNIGDFLKDAGIDDITIINIFGKVDLKKSDVVGGREITNIVIDE